jgi:hypothetical protein
VEEEGEERIEIDATKGHERSINAHIFFPETSFDHVAGVVVVVVAAAAWQEASLFFILPSNSVVTCSRYDCDRVYEQKTTGME